MTKPLEQPDDLKVYMLLKQTGAYLCATSSSTSSISGTSLGVGFFWTRDEAEQHRTMEILKMQPTDNSMFHVFELEIPNIAKKTK
jgi:hypothetical protein